MRPLSSNDVDTLTDFLVSLSPLTRERWVIDSYDRTAAQEMCDSVDRTDKLRLAIFDHSQTLIGLMEVSLILMPFDIERFTSYGMDLHENKTIRFGPCIRDDFRQQRVFSTAMPKVIDIAKRLGRDLMILWGGVMADNEPAIKSYEKLGFYEVGRFNDRIDGSECVDMVLEL